jgi:hypothetical protein
MSELKNSQQLKELLGQNIGAFKNAFEDIQAFGEAFVRAFQFKDESEVDDLFDVRTSDPLIAETQVEGDTPLDRISKAIVETDAYAELNTAQRRFNTSFLASIEALKDADAQRLNLHYRKKMISLIADFVYAGGTSEECIIKLLKATPSGEEKIMLDWLRDEKLLPVLESKVHGDNYKNYQAALRVLYFNSMPIEQVEEKMKGITKKENAGKPKSVGQWAKEDHIFYWLSPGLFSQFKYHFHRVNYSDMKFTKEGKLSFDMQHTYIMTDPKEHIELEPYEMIAVKFITKPEAMEAPEGEELTYMPAINLYALYNEQWNQEAIAAVDVALLMAGGIGLIAKGSRLAKLVAILDTTLAAAALVINDPVIRNKIAETEQGRKFLEVWDTVNGLIAIYGLAKVVVKLPKILQKLKSVYKEFKQDPGKGLKKEEVTRIDEQVTKVTKTSDEIKIEQIKNASKEERLKELSYDPFKKKNDLYEGEIGYLMEGQFGYFQRSPDVAGDFQSLSGPYKDKIFDAFGIPADQIKKHQDDLKIFLPSVDRHFYKVQSKGADYLILDIRAMNSQQLITLENYINQKWGAFKTNLFYLK